MRIIGGAFRGRALAAVGRGDAGAHLRPTTDRVRESLFNVLQGGRFGDPIDGARVLDLFAGTGALGIEALSRGAGRVVLLDSDTGPAEANVEALGLAGRVELVRADALAFLRRGSHGPGGFDLVLVDPPYRLARPLGSELTKLLPHVLRPGGRVVTESSVDAPLGLDPEALTMLDERRYGSTLIRIHGAAEVSP